MDMSLYAVVNYNQRIHLSACFLVQVWLNEDQRGNSELQ
jgi:hypothetical protein